jgi:hypothetical protein
MHLTGEQVHVVLDHVEPRRRRQQPGDPVYPNHPAQQGWKRHTFAPLFGRISNTKIQRLAVISWQVQFWNFKSLLVGRLWEHKYHVYPMQQEGLILNLICCNNSLVPLGEQAKCIQILPISAHKLYKSENICPVSLQKANSIETYLAR